MKHLHASLLLMATLLAGPAFAKNPHKGGKGGKNDGGIAIDANFKIFSQEQQRRITRCFEGNPKGLPPGLAKRETLPPGLEKHLRKNGTLPPGLQKKVQPFPSACHVGLPRLPDGWLRIIIADRVVLLDPHKRISDWFRLSIRIG